MADLIIRAAVAGDCQVLAELNAEVQGLHVANRPDEFKPPVASELASWFAGLLEDRSTTVWLAEDAGVPVGYVVVVVRETPDTPFCVARLWWEVDQVSVASTHRHGGVARALLEKVSSEGRAQGVRALELQTWAFNRDAQAAFQRLGFVPKRTRYERLIDVDDTPTGA